jgi:hypothetical protein
MPMCRSLRVERVLITLPHAHVIVVSAYSGCISGFMVQIKAANATETARGAQEEKGSKMRQARRWRLVLASVAGLPAAAAV